jgi:CRISPR type III-A-associated RAMP protein Csm5
MISKIIELETLSPLFIKGKDLDYGEGMLRGSDGVVYLIDNDKLCEYIVEKKKVEEYVQEFDGRNKNPSLKSFLNRNNIYPNDNELKKIAKGITEISERFQRDDEDKKTNFIQNGKKKPFIPGTSLKGSIRNAVLWKFFEDKKNKFLLDTFFSSQREFLDKELQGLALISDALVKAESQDFDGADEKMKLLFESSFSKKEQFEKSKNDDGFIIYTQDFNSVEKILHGYQKNFAQYFSKKTFQNNRSILSKLKFEQLPVAKKDLKYISKKDFNARWEKGKKNNSLVDFFRLVKVSDGNITEDNSLEWLQVKTICKDNFSQTYMKEHVVTLECVPKATKAHFKISIDTELAKAFFPDGVPTYLHSVEELLRVVDEFFRSVANSEYKEFFSGAKPIPNNINRKEKVDTGLVEQFYKSTFGLQPDAILFRTGWGGGFMSKTQFLHIEMADRVRVRDMIRYNGSPIAPKSRCQVVKGPNATEPLGWCKLSVLGDAKDILLPGIESAKIETDFLTVHPRSRGQQKSQRVRQNHEKQISEKETRKLRVAENIILRQSVKHNQAVSQMIFTKGQTVSATVEKCVPFESVTVKIGNQVLTINKGVMKQKGETVKVQINKIENGNITEAKLL